MSHHLLLSSYRAYGLNIRKMVISGPALAPGRIYTALEGSHERPYFWLQVGLQRYIQYSLLLTGAPEGEKAALGTHPLLFRFSSLNSSLGCLALPVGSICSVSSCQAPKPNQCPRVRALTSTSTLRAQTLALLPPSLVEFGRVAACHHLLGRPSTPMTAVCCTPLRNPTPRPKSSRGSSTLRFPDSGIHSSRTFDGAALD